MNEHLNLQNGDVIRASHNNWPEGSFIEGAVRNGRVCGHGVEVMNYSGLWTVTVISRAAKPVYVNSDRTEHVVGDVVAHDSVYLPDPDRRIGPYYYTGTYRWAGARPGGQMTPWVSVPYGAPDTGPLYDAGKLVLLIDGKTGKGVSE